MSHNNPIIDSGIVEAPIPSDSQYSRQKAAPSQASQEGNSGFGQRGQQGNADQTHNGEQSIGAGQTQATTDPMQTHDQNTTTQQPSSDPEPYQRTNETQEQAPPLPPREHPLHTGQDKYIRQKQTQHSNAENLEGTPGTSIAGEKRYFPSLPQQPTGLFDRSAELERHLSGGRAISEAPDNNTPASQVEASVEGAKGLVKGVHGVGETLRGTFNREVDRAFGDKAGLAKNDHIAQSGRAEIQEGGMFNKLNLQNKERDANWEKNREWERNRSGALGGRSTYY